MRSDDSTSRRSLKGGALKGAAGLALMLSCAAGTAALISVPGGGRFTNIAPAQVLPVATRVGSTKAMAEAGHSAEARSMDRVSSDHTSSPTTQAGGGAVPEDAEIAVLLDWHLAANNVYGAIQLEDLPQ